MGTAKSRCLRVPLASRSARRRKNYLAGHECPGCPVSLRTLRANLALAAAGLARMYSKGLPTEQMTDRLASSRAKPNFQEASGMSTTSI